MAMNTGLGELFRRMASAVLTRRGQSYGGRKAVRGTKAADPFNREMDLQPGEYASEKGARAGEYAGDPDASADVELVTKRFESAAEHRREWESEAVLCCAFVEGRQWLAWDSARHRAINLMTAKEQHRYVTRNLLRPLVAKLLALATMTKPDATPAPMTEAEVDRLAASEARAITGHLSRKYGGSEQTRQVARWAAITGIGWLKHYWDPEKRADIPRWGVGPNGLPTIAGRVSAPVGEECEHVVAPFEVFCEPVKQWDEVRWLIHASVKPLAWFVERFGAVGKTVEPDQWDASGGYVDCYLTEQDGGVSLLSTQYGTRERRAATCLEMWEKPSATYPKGRLIVVAGKRRLHAGPWPLESEDFPFSRMVYDEAIGHVYGRGIVCDLAPIQMELNRYLTKAVTRFEDSKDTLLREKLSGSGADAFQSDGRNTKESRNFREVFFNRGSRPPLWVVTPDISGDAWRLIESAWLHMQHIVGIHDVNMGGAPPGMTAGIAIALAQEGDRTQLGLFTGHIEQYAAQRDRLRIRHYAQFATPYLPRLMGLDESGNPEQARMKAQAFRALTGGGAVDIIVSPGSATPKTPAGRMQEILTYYGPPYELFGPAMSLEAKRTAVKLLQMAESSVVLEGLDRVAAEMAEMAEMAQALGTAPGVEAAGAFGGGMPPIPPQPGGMPPLSGGGLPPGLMPSPGGMSPFGDPAAMAGMGQAGSAGPGAMPGREALAELAARMAAGQGQ